MKICRFRVGDRVDINTKMAMSATQFKSALADQKVRNLLFGRKGVHGRVVIFLNFEERLRHWIVWIESPAGEVLRFEEHLLLDRPENFTRTQAGIRKGTNAREIFGLPEAAPPEPKKYYRVVFKDGPKDE